MRPFLHIAVCWLFLVLMLVTCRPGFAQPAHVSPSAGVIQLPQQWEYSRPLVAPEERSDEPSRAQKDPTFVYHDGIWHLFMTVKLPGRSAIEYCQFKTWEEANDAPRHLLNLCDSDYFCAAQVFYFRPHKKWYLVYQAGMPGAKKMWVAYSTTDDISDPTSWTKIKPMLDGGADDERTVGGLDYWIICDDENAWLFYTSLNGKMWRMKTSLENFPSGFHDCQLALKGPIFEASHTYRIANQGKYLTIIEQKGRRHLKAYLADRLDGKWTALAATEERPFAGFANVRPAKGVSPWTDNISHGELIRTSNDERLLIDGDHLRFVFQGMLQKHKANSGYGQFQWRLGMLTPVAEIADTDQSSQQN